MCGRLNIAGKVYIPGTKFHIQTHKGSDIITNVGTWGISYAYNARIETVESKWDWVVNNRGILTVNGFYEKDRYITRFDKPIIDLGVLYDNEFNFVIITTDAQFPINRIHHRMPLIIEHTDDWIINGNANIIDYNLKVA